MRTIKELSRADTMELSPTRSDITEELFEHVAHLRKRAIDAEKKLEEADFAMKVYEADNERLEAEIDKLKVQLDIARHQRDTNLL